MIVLHAAWLEGALRLWGETPVDVPGTHPARHDRAATRKPARPSRTGAGAAELVRSLLETPVPVVIEMRDVRETLAWLPTAAGRVVPSSPLIGRRAQAAGSKTPAAIAPWIVMSAPLATDDAIVLLCSCVGQRTLAPGVILGADLIWWADLVRFAGAIVARQKYLPGMAAAAGGAWRARWEPILDPEDADRLAGIARRMPAVARALGAGTTSRPLAPPQTAALSVAKEVTGEFVDHIIRSAASDLIESPRAFRLRPFDSVHDAWMHALRSADATIVADQEDLQKHAAHVREWRRPIAVSTAAPIRLCLRLEEPEDADEASAVVGVPPPSEGTHPTPDSWIVRFLIQPHDDPSLLIPIQDAWNVQGRIAAALGRDRVRVHETILSALGAAAGIDPGIAASLDAAGVPPGYVLDAAGAHEFLTVRAAILEDAGFGVLLPSWWTGRGTKARLTIKGRVRAPKMQVGRISLDEVLHFDWEVALGDVTLTLRELEALASLKAPLLRVRGQWVELNAAEIEQAIAVWKRKGGDRATARDAIQMALGAKRPPGGFELAGVEASGWIADLIGRLQGHVAFQELPSPNGFVGVLRPYQVRGFSWLVFLRQWGLGGCLADDMGLGKTIQALALVQHEWSAARRSPVLIVCPTSVVNNWRREAERFTPALPVMVHHGSDRKKGAAFTAAARRHAIVISSYGLLQRDLDLLRGVPWAGVILDEAQNIKNPETKQARCARSIVAEYRFALTGTPVENNVGDLWSIMEFLNTGLLGRQAEFKRRFFVPIQAGRDPEAASRLKRIITPFILRRVKTDRSIITDLPEKLEMKVFCTLTREQASLYTAVVKDAETKLVRAHGLERRGVILATLSKLKQVCNHPAQFLRDNSTIQGRSGKLARLTEMLEETIAVGDRALVFSQFAEMGELLRRHLEATFGREVLFLHGGIPKAKRDRMIDRFQDGDGGAPPVFVLSLKAGGTGLNLTRANHVFHFDRWWNPAVENQATDRAFRIGQFRNVQVHKFICAGTLEEKIDEMIESKKEIAEQIIGVGESWLTELSNTDLKRLLALRADAVGE